LKEKGVDCVYREYKGVLHAFLHYSRIMKAADDAIKEGGEFFKNAK
jgi:acetyl esterase